MALVVKDSFIHWGAGNEHPIYVLSGSATEAIPGQKSLRLLSEDAFEPGTHARAYVETYGVLIGPENLRDRAPTEVDTYGGWILHEDADGAWATNGRIGGHITARRVDQLYDLIDEFDDGEED